MGQKCQPLDPPRLETKKGKEKKAKEGNKQLERERALMTEKKGKRGV